MTFDIQGPALVLLIGPSGAGKSTFARANFRPTEIVSSDDLRAWVADDPADQDATADAFKVLHLVVNGRLKRRLTAVVDATNLRASSRRQLRSLAGRYGLPVVAIVFDLPEQAYFDNNALRPDRRVASDVIDAQLELMRRVLTQVEEEGYSAIYYVR